MARRRWAVGEDVSFHDMAKQSRCHSAGLSRGCPLKRLARGAVGVTNGDFNPNAVAAGSNYTKSMQ
jgi:hypothetical protein